MRRTKAFILIGIAAILAGTTATSEANYKIDWYVIGGGGGTASSGSYSLTGTIGQPAAGFVSGGGYLHWVGFWSGALPNPTLIDRISDAKLLADGEFISLSGNIASSSGSDFQDFFYVQAPDRSSGIRVAISSAAVSGLARGSIVNVVGTLGTTSSGERVLESPTVIITSSGPAPDPLFMANKTIGGASFGTPPLGQYGISGVTAGVNNVGLLIRTSGRVVAADGSFRTIDDGSGVLVRVDTSFLATPPSIGDFVIVTGVSSLHQQGGNRNRLVLPRDGSDLTAP